MILIKIQSTNGKARAQRSFKITETRQRIDWIKSITDRMVKHGPVNITTETL